jgi:hypothetical protein
MYSWLSLPPEAICLSSGDHFSPHTCTYACTVSTPALLLIVFQRKSVMCRISPSTQRSTQGFLICISLPSVKSVRRSVQTRGYSSQPTSDLWALSTVWKSSGARISRCKMLRSREPVLRMWLLHAMVPTRPLWPSKTRTLQYMTVSDHLHSSIFSQQTHETTKMSA